MGEKRKDAISTRNEAHNDDDHKSPTSEFHDDDDDDVVTYCCDVTDIMGAMIKKEVMVMKNRLGGTIIPCPKRSKLAAKMSSGTFDENMETIWRSFSQDKRAVFTHLESFYFNSYINRPTRALELIRKKEIFSKKDHWRLVIFCHFGEPAHSKTRTRCILLLDSAKMCANVIVPDLRKFVFDIFTAEGRPESKDVIFKIPLKVAKVPQQTNDVDCGRFVLYFIKRFMDVAPENFSLSNYPYFLTSDWFKPEEFNKFCDKLDEETPRLEQGVEKVIPRRYSQRMKYTGASAKQPSRNSFPQQVILIDDSDSDSDSETSPGSDVI
ncbi:uncharacterized protein [Spinacia oleracea]|uniref:Uncharacterized protein isoform X2 n=1 Tax=Spinacia oleracea TaxID=3562 RepID=A0A9R0IC43_SPIOL|nr:uncharacterized protein LOC110786223 isoform X2 [Spinacia oleracea]